MNQKSLSLMAPDWDHNNHYHQFLLNELPTSINYALDIGCGHGDFAAHLAKRATCVDAIEMDCDVLNEAQLRYSVWTNLRFVHGDFLEQELPLAHYDVIISLAAIHHMALGTALHKIEQLLRPGGTLIILGLYRATTITDHALSLLGVVGNFVYQNLIYRQQQPELEKAVPIQTPLETLAEIRHIAGEVIPGCQIRRHLLWRYSLIWRKPL